MNGLIPNLIALSLLLAASVFDLRTRIIPDSFAILMLVLAVVCTALALGPTWASRLIGLAVAFAIGTLLFAIGAFGGGDAKLLAALGGYVGLTSLFGTLLWIGIAGGVISAICLVRGVKEVPYVTAITAGWVFFVLLGSPV